MGRSRAHTSEFTADLRLLCLAADQETALTWLLSAAPDNVRRLLPQALQIVERKAAYAGESSEAVVAIAWDLMRRGFSHFEKVRPGTADCVVAAEGLRTGYARSRAQAAKSIGISAASFAESVRFFWESILEEGRKRRTRRKNGKHDVQHLLPLDKARAARKWFVAAFLILMIGRQGSVILDPGDTSTYEISLTRFLAKCSGIPMHKYDALSFEMLGQLELDEEGLLRKPESIENLVPGWVTLEGIEKEIEAIAPELILQDRRKIAAAVRECRLGRLNRTERAAICFNYIARPMHYSELCKVYRQFFPEDPLDERSIHSLLLRDSYKGDKALVVWTGVRGVFALRTWGVERPGQTLSRQVEDIVLRKYAETDRPVPLSVVMSELAASRPFVKQDSVVTALKKNPNIRYLGSELFVPVSAKTAFSREDRTSPYLPLEHEDETHSLTDSPAVSEAFPGPSQGMERWHGGEVPLDLALRRFESLRRARVHADDVLSQERAAQSAACPGNVVDVVTGDSAEQDPAPKTPAWEGSPHGPVNGHEPEF